MEYERVSLVLSHLKEQERGVWVEFGEKQLMTMFELVSGTLG